MVTMSFPWRLLKSVALTLAHSKKRLCQVPWLLLLSNCLFSDALVGGAGGYGCSVMIVLTQAWARMK